MYSVKHASRATLLTRSIMALFVPKKRNVTIEGHPELYYKHYWINKRLSDGIEFIAEVEGTTRKNAIEQLIEAGLKDYMGKNIRNFLEDMRATEARNEQIQRTRFIRHLIRFGRRNGEDLSKLFKQRSDG